MSVFGMVGFVLLTSFAVSYGWGMRGALIGGEKGALLPGALLGIMIARFSGSELIYQNYWFFAAAGALAMSYGGSETYGQTIGMVLHRGMPDYNKRRGTAGLALKGAIWFAIAGGVLAMTFSALSGAFYRWYDIVLLLATLPFTGEIGFRIFNKPYDKKTGNYPKFYFSTGRQEEWGRNVVFIAELAVFAAIRKDFFTLIMLLFGAVFGAVGWVVAITLFEYAKYPLKNGKSLYGPLGEKGLVEGWKTMEFTLGAFGGLGISLGFLACKKYVGNIVGIIENNGGFWNPLSGYDKGIGVFCIVCLFIVLFVNALERFCELKNIELNDGICDFIERPFYSNLPLILVLLGSVTAARLFSFYIIWLVMAIKCAFERFSDFKFRSQVIWYAIFGVTGILLLIADFKLGGFSAPTLVALCGLPYFGFDMVYCFRSENRKIFAEKRKNGAGIVSCLGLVPLYFLFQIIVLYAICFKIL